MVVKPEGDEDPFKKMKETTEFLTAVENFVVNTRQTMLGNVEYDVQKANDNVVAFMEKMFPAFQRGKKTPKAKEAPKPEADSIDVVVGRTGDYRPPPEQKEAPATPQPEPVSATVGWRPDLNHPFFGLGGWGSRNRHKVLKFLYGVYPAGSQRNVLVTCMKTDNPNITAKKLGGYISNMLWHLKCEGLVENDRGNAIWRLTLMGADQIRKDPTKIEPPTQLPPEQAKSVSARKSPGPMKTIVIKPEITPELLQQAPLKAKKEDRPIRYYEPSPHVRGQSKKGERSRCVAFDRVLMGQRMENAYATRPTVKYMTATKLAKAIVADGMPVDPVDILRTVAGLLTEWKHANKCYSCSQGWALGISPKILAAREAAAREQADLDALIQAAAEEAANSPIDNDPRPQ